MTAILERLNRLLWVQSPTGIPADLRERPEGLLDLALAEDFGFDSVDVSEFWCAIEDEFALDISNAEIEAAATIRDIVVLIEARTGTAGTPGTRPSNCG